jgi:hypothetical protein
MVVSAVTYNPVVTSPTDHCGMLTPMLSWLQLGRHPKLTGALAAAAAAAGVYYWRLSSQKAALERAATLQRSIRVLKQRDPRLLARLLSHLFTSSVRVAQ